MAEKLKRKAQGGRRSVKTLTAQLNVMCTPEDKELLAKLAEGRSAMLGRRVSVGEIARDIIRGHCKLRAETRKKPASGKGKTSPIAPIMSDLAEERDDQPSMFPDDSNTNTHRPHRLTESEEYEQLRELGIIGPANDTSPPLSPDLDERAAWQEMMDAGSDRSDDEGAADAI